MTPEERQTLRDKHVACFADTYKDQYVCRSCSSDDVSTLLVYYPCDTIKALNWAEWLLEELKSISEIREGA
jgi:hypothetical protein